MSSPPRTGRRRDFWLPLAPILAAHLALSLRFWWVTDDAYISFRFARNLALGHGPRFNVWDAAPVEGYSNFLWVLVGAGLHALGLDMVAWTPILSWLCGALLLAVLLDRLVRALDVPPWLAAVSVLGLACYPPFAVWSTSGLATMPFALLLFLTFDRLLLARGELPWFAAGLCGAGLALVRAEGLAWFAVLLALAVFRQLVERRLRVAPLARATALVVAVAAAHVTWRLAYYGEWLPNTVAVKSVHGDGFLERGFHYVAASWTTFLVPFLILPGALLALRPRRFALGLPVAALAWAFPVYAVVVSGDYMPMGRFLVPGLPFATILVAWMLADLAGRSAGRGALAVVAGLGVAVLGLLPAWEIHVLDEDQRSWCNYRFRRAGDYSSEVARWRALNTRVAAWRKRGRQLRAFADAHLDPPASVVLQTLGAVGYESDLLAYDCAGLIVPEIARTEITEWKGQPGHDKAVEPMHFLDDRPTILYYENFTDPPSRVPFRVREQLGRWKRRQVRQLYEPRLARMVSADGDEDFVLLLVRSESPAPAAWQAHERMRDLGAAIEVPY